MKTQNSTVQIRLVNDFHNAQTTLRVKNAKPGEIVKISAYQYRRAWKVLCGMDDCRCGTCRGCGGDGRLLVGNGKYFIEIRSDKGLDVMDAVSAKIARLHAAGNHKEASSFGELLGAYRSGHIGLSMLKSAL